MTLILPTLITLAGLVLSAVFSGLETGFYTLNRVRLSVRRSRGEAAALRLHRMIEHSNRTLATLLIGNNIANYAGSYGVALLLTHAGVSDVQAIFINAAILVPLLFVVGEVLPKDLFRTYTDSWSYVLSGFLATVDRMLRYSGLNLIVRSFGGSIARLFGSTSDIRTTARQRMSDLIKEGVTAGVISESQTTLIDRGLSLRDCTVGEEMIPWARVVRLRLSASNEQRRQLMRERNFTRMPVVDNADRVVGILTLLDVLLDPERPTRQLMKPFLTFKPTTPVLQALQQMREKGASLAIIAGRTGHPAGIVTLKDLVEPLTGEIAAW